MTVTPRDPLLSAARIATIIVRIALALGAVGLSAALVIHATGVAPLADHVKVQVEPVALADIAGSVSFLLLIYIISLALMYDFTARLARIIDTVGDGDPFITANADRLWRMGWLAVALQVLAVPAALLEALADTSSEGNTLSISSDSGISLGALGLALVLFILARIFRKGAQMREDLEGTV